MKLSSMTTGQAMDTLCAITPYVSRIVGDEALMDALKEKLGTDRMSVAEVCAFGVQKLSTLVPIILKDHREDVYSVLATVEGISPEVVASQNVMATMKQIKELVQDKDLVDFFASWGYGEENT